MPYTPQPATILPSTPPPASFPVLNRKLANVRAGTGPLRLLCLGDSKVWGSIGGAVPNPPGPGGPSWPSQLAALLNTFDVPADIGFSVPQPYSLNVPTTDTRWVTAAGWTTGYMTYPAMLYGIGGQASWVGAVGASDMTYTPGTSCDTFDVYYISTVGLGTFKLAVDAAASGGSLVNASVAPTAIRKATISAGSVGSGHVLHIGAVATAGCAIVGVEAYLAAGAKIRVGNAGVVGSAAFQQADQLTAQALGSLATIQAYAPDLTIINLSGTIDGFFSFTPTQVLNAVKAIVAACSISGDVILMTETPTLDGTGTALGSTLALEAAMAPILAAYAAQAGLGFVDAYTAFLPANVLQTQGYYNWTVSPTDAYHLSTLGNSYVASLALRAVLQAQAAAQPRTDASQRLLTGVVTPGTSVNGTVHDVAAAGGTATLAAVAGVTNWVTGFEITGGGATAASLVNATLTGVAGGPLNFTVPVPAGATVGLAPVVVEFPEPLPATGPNVAITLVVPALGAGNTVLNANLHGFQL